MDKLRDSFKKAMDTPKFLEVMGKIYIPPYYASGEEYQKMVELGFKENGDMIRELGLHKSQKDIISQLVEGHQAGISEPISYIACHSRNVRIVDAIASEPNWPVVSGYQLRRTLEIILK